MGTSVIQKGLPFDSAAGGVFPQIQAAPYRIIYDSSQANSFYWDQTVGAGSVPLYKNGNIYKNFGSVVEAANAFQGPVEIYIRNNSPIPVGNYSMPASWSLGTDSNGCTIPSGTTFSTAPLSIHPDCAATITLGENTGLDTFVLANPMMTISTCSLVLGTNGSLVNGANGGGLFLRAVTVSTSNQTLMTGTDNTVTCLDVTTLANNVLPGSMTVQYDPTSRVGSQNGNTGTALFTSLVGPAGPAGATGPAGPAGPAGSGGASYLPATEPADNNTYQLNVNGSGVASWIPVGGYVTTSAGISQGAAEITPSSSPIASINWNISFNFIPTANFTVSCTNPGGTAPTAQTITSVGQSYSGTFTPAGGFYALTPGTTCTVSVSGVLAPGGAPYNGNIGSFAFYARVLWAVVTTPVAGQALWNTMLANASVLDTNGGKTNSLSWTDAGTANSQTFARLSSYGTPVIQDSGGDIYPPTSLGTVSVTENGVAGVSYSFWTVAQNGLTIALRMTG